MRRTLPLALAIILLAGCGGASAPPESAGGASTAAVSSAPASPSELTPQQRASILAAAGYPADPAPATKAAYVRDLDAIDRDIVHGKADKAVSRGRDTCRSIKEGADRTKLVDLTNRRFTSPSHPEGHGLAVAARILDVAHRRLCPAY